MTPQEQHSIITNELHQLLIENKYWAARKIYKKYKHIIEDHTKNIPYYIKDSERLYCYINKLHKLPVCKMCNKNVKFLEFNKGYNSYCCKQCRSNDVNIKIKTYTTILKNNNFIFSNDIERLVM